MAKTKYSKELVSKICSLIENGAENENAFNQAGISKTTAYRWLDPDDETNPLTPEQIREFREGMVTARAKRVTVLASRIIRASEPIYLRDENNDIRLDSNARPVILKRGDWRAAAWYLERTEPDTYASKDKHEFSGDGLNLNVGLGQEEGKGLFKNIVQEIGNEKKYIKRKAKKAKVKLKKS